MAFRNFLYVKTDMDFTFLPKDPSLEFGTGSPSTSINTELLLLNVEPVYEANTEQIVENVADLGGSPMHQEKMDDSLFLTISDDGEDVELLDLHDRFYAKQAVMDNAVNRRAQELLKVVEQIKGECDVLKARDKECEELKARCKAAMMDFDNNPAVKVLRERIVALLVEVASLEAKKVRLEVIEASLCQELEDVRRDRAEVVSKVVLYIIMELVHSDQLGMLVGKLVSSAVFYGRCATFEEVVEMREPFNLTKVVADPLVLVEALLSKKPPTLQRPTPMRTHAIAPSSQNDTSSSALVSKSQSPLAV
nr:hypothetical protein [Tanacetum cinerariifolium]